MATSLANSASVAKPFIRTRFTWFVYAIWMFFGFFVNVLGPITPFLKTELNLSYTISSLHFTAFALGLLGSGLIAQAVVQRIGAAQTLWFGMSGMSAGVLLLLIGTSPWLTIPATLVMGLVGGLLGVVVPTLLAELYGEQRAVPLAESNLLSSLIGMFAPLLVGWAVNWFGGWRLAVGVVTLLPLLIYFGFRQIKLPAPPTTHADSNDTSLPRQFWLYWIALYFGVAIEFCMLSWSADYLKNVQGLSATAGAQAVSLFLAGMILGRWSSSQLVQRFGAKRLVLASLGIAALGFGLFWQGSGAPIALGGLFITGVGVAGLYPLILSLAIGTTRNIIFANARASLAGSLAILSLPLLLGRLADAVGIQLAYGVVGGLIALAAAFVLWASKA